MHWFSADEPKYIPLSGPKQSTVGNGGMALALIAVRQYDSAGYTIPD
jgi:hypothetical protein